MISMVFIQESEKSLFKRNPIFMMSKICKISGKIQTRHVIRWIVLLTVVIFQRDSLAQS